MIDKEVVMQYHIDVQEMRERLQVFIKDELIKGTSSALLTTALFEEATHIMLAELGAYNSICVLIDAINTFAHTAPHLEKGSNIEDIPTEIIN